jgi:chemotaxis protein MotB
MLQSLLLYLTRKPTITPLLHEKGAILCSFVSESLGIELAPLRNMLFAILQKEETMRRILIDRTMPLRAPVLAMLCIVAVMGCVSSGTHTKTLTELEAEKKTSAQLQQQLAGLQQNLDQEAAQRKAAEQQATELQSRLGGRITDLEQKLASGSASSREEIARLQKQAADLEANSARIEKEREQLRQEQSRLAATLDQERAAKEEEIKRLTRTQEELSKSLQDEISKGNITIQQVRDRLTINMVDRVLFDSGQAQVKPAGVKVLKQVADVLNKITDKQIRIEGHTDNVPISSKLQGRFKTNWELSTARATTVVRYLIDHGGVDRQYLSAVGYADTHPLASDDSEEGRATNRRIEIVLYPKDLKEIAGEVETNTAGSK